MTTMRKLFVVLLGLLLSLAVVNAHAATVKLVVHATNGTDSISKAKIADLFLKRVTRWENGRAVTPVDQSEKSSLRTAFTKELLGKEVAWVKSYWQKMIFSGRATPPAELPSDREVLELVRTNPDAIGYVADTATIPAGVKVLTVQ
jgi:ABC-type phosphate transport system substrate-binding protein